VTGEQPAQPSIECWETATFNNTTCSWDVTGSQPAQPSIECWETATFNNTTCSWDVTGSQPEQPTLQNCWDNYQFNLTTCSWENMGSQPEQPNAVNCWDNFQFNTASCAWVNVGSPTTFYIDSDGDGFGDASGISLGCVLPAGYSLNNSDCDDLSFAVYPGAAEICNDSDDNCNGAIDEGLDATFYADADGDGFGNPFVTLIDCQAPAGYVSNAEDCDDTNSSVNPSSQEICGNSVDENCSGQVNEDCCPITPSATGAVTNASCAAFADGSIDVSIIANSEIYTVSWSNGLTLEDLDGIIPGVYTLSISDANGCQGSTTFTVGNNNFTTPTPAQIGGPYGVCRSSVGITFSTPEITGATSYQWILPSGATGSSNTNTITLNFSSTYSSGNLGVRAIGPCGQSATYSRGVYALITLPVAPSAINGPVSNVCAGSTQVFTCTAVSAAESYVWTAPTNATIVSGQGTQTVTVSFSSNFGASGSLTVRSQNCFGISTARSFTVYSVPTAPVSIAGSANNVCAGSVLTYNVAAIPGATGYTWTAPNNTTILAGQGTNSISLSIGASFVSGTLSVIATSNCGQSAARSLGLSRNPATPSAMSGQISNLCGGGQFTYSVVPVNGATSYVWTVPSGCTIVTNAGNSIVLNVSSTFTNGTLSVRAFNSCGGSSLRSVSLTRLPATPASITGVASVCPNEIGVEFTTPAVTGVTQLWTVPSGVTITDGQGTTNMISNWGTTAGNVTVRSVNACGQSATLTRAVSLLSCAPERELALSDQRASEFEVYPNPTRGSFYVKSTTEGEFELLNGIGQLIETFFIGNSQSFMKEMYISSAGVYFIRAKSDGETLRVVVVN
jgi:hypothetical protein